MAIPSRHRKLLIFSSMLASVLTLQSVASAQRKLLVLSEIHAILHLTSTVGCRYILDLTHLSLSYIINSGPSSVWIRSEMNQDVFFEQSGTSGALAIMTYTTIYAAYESTSDPVTGSAKDYSVNDRDMKCVARTLHYISFIHRFI